MLIILAAVFLAGAPASAVKHFHKMERSSVPFGLFESQFETFDRANPKEAHEAFLSSVAGEAWSADLDDDGAEEILIVPDDWSCGSGGCEASLFQKKGTMWVQLAADGGVVGTMPSRGLDVLPVIRHGYHDIRMLDDCLKWNGRRYVAYAPSDYRQLSPAWFDQSDFWSGVILWEIECAGRRKLRFQPQWVPDSPDWSQNDEVDDPARSIEWIATFKGGIYGVSGDRSFLLLERPAYRGAEKLQLEGDWLAIYARPETKLITVARHNRRTHELKINRKIWN
jgi:hypothetical protein